MRESDPEDLNQALRDVVKALGGFEAVGADMYPTKTRKKAGDWLGDQLNPNRDAKLSLEEFETIMLMGRQAGLHTVMHYLAYATHYERPEPSAPSNPRTVLIERRAKIARERLKLDEEELAIQKDIDRMDQELPSYETTKFPLRTRS